MLRIAVAPWDGSRRTRMIVSDRGLTPAFVSPQRRSEPRTRIVCGSPESTSSSTSSTPAIGWLKRLNASIELSISSRTAVAVAVAVRKTIARVPARNFLNIPRARRGGSCGKAVTWRW
jgi:hypothetical protein